LFFRPALPVFVFLPFPSFSLSFMSLFQPSIDSFLPSCALVFSTFFVRMSVGVFRVYFTSSVNNISCISTPPLFLFVLILLNHFLTRQLFVCLLR
jgi:hypothetical protein